MGKPKAADVMNMLSTTASEAVTPIKPVEAATANPRGESRRFGVYMTGDDEQQLRQLAAFLSSQGRKVSDAAILKTGLYLMKNGDALLKAYDETMKRDKRYKK